jgi:hypothetical protein
VEAPAGRSIEKSSEKESRSSIKQLMINGDYKIKN